MKGLLAVILVVAVVAFYFGYGPTDLMYLFPSIGSSAPPAKVRHAALPPSAETQTAAPAPNNGGPTVIANGPDGSLANRWKAFPNSSPSKP